MDDNVRPIREDLSDDALFGGIAPAPAAGGTMVQTTEQTTAAVATAVRIMRAAGLKLLFGTAVDDTEVLWAMRLSNLSSEAIIKSATVWIESGSKEFPTLSEFETLATSQQRAIDHPPRPEREPGGSCPGCGDSEENPTEGFALAEPDDGGTRTLRPCEDCNPERYTAWRRGWPRKKKSSR